LFVAPAVKSRDDEKGFLFVAPAVKLRDDEKGFLVCGSRGQATG
jgi:hypothetical protein